MDSRRTSAISTASVRNRKYSTDRHLRQAELSARLEEGRPIQVRADQIDEDPTENEGEKVEELAVRTLTRADTIISPFDVHPGRRVDSFPLAKAAGINTKFGFNITKPWNEPSAAQQDDIERRAAVIGRVQTASLDVGDAQAQLYRSVAKKKPQHAVRRWFLPGRSSKRRVEASAFNGLYIAAAMNAALGLQLVANKAPDWFKRQQLHVLEYTTSETNSFTCYPNPPFPDTDSLKQHLLAVRSPAPHRIDGQSVRLIHIRNNVEAFRYMDEAFGISSPDIHYGERGFQEWMQEDRDSRRTSNMTIRWRPGFDTHRQVICMAVGIDLGSSDVTIENAGSAGSDLGPQDAALFRKRRIAIYLQRTSSAAVPNPKVTQFNSRGRTFANFAEQDNIVICEYASDAWSEISNTPSLLALAPTAGLHKSGSAAVMASAISHLFWEVVTKWQSQIAAIHQPFAELEDSVYETPANMMHASQVWDWSKRLQHMLKLAVRHLKAIQTFQDDFELFAELGGRVEWLDDVLIEMKHVAETIRGDYIEPLEHMIDLMYKSVTIRDSRLSLELGTSLWRLSWITFIFLPLTFLVGFFGMNVGLFKEDPSIRWYFVALVPLAAIIAGFWVAFNKLGWEISDDQAERQNIELLRRANSTSGQRPRWKSIFGFG